MLISIIRRGAHPLVLSVCSIPSFEEVQGIVRISFPYLGKRSSLLSRYLGGPVRLVLGWSSLLSHEVGGSCQSFFEDQVECFSE